MLAAIGVTGLLGAGAVVFAFAATFLLLRIALGHARRERMRASMWRTTSESDDGSAFERMVRNGCGPLLPAARWACRTKRIESLMGEVSCWLESTRGLVCPVVSATSLLMGVLLVLGVLGSLVAGNPVGGLAADVLVLVVMALRVQAWRDSELDALRDAVPAALNVMGECFSSGYSLVQTMGQVADQTEGRLSALFARCANVLKLGGTSREALECLRSEQSVSELSFVAVALDVQHQAGGSIVSVLGNACRMVEDEIELRRSLRVQTAQARLSARVVCVMPFVLVAVLSLMSEGFLSAFFESVAGMALLAVALVMQAAGVLMVRRMLRVAE